MAPPTQYARALRRVSSRGNAQLKELRRSFAQGGPVPGSLVAIEGVRMVEEAIRSGLKVHTLFLREPVEASAERLLGQIGGKAEALAVERAAFDSAVETESPQGVAALVAVRSWSLDDLLGAPNDSDGVKAPLILAAAALQDPGNLGTLIRSAEAFGATGALLLEGTVSAFNPKVVRAAAGSLFRLPVVSAKFAEALPRLKQAGVRLVAGSSHRGTPLPAANLSGALCLVVGNEGAGAPRALASAVDEWIAIPHSPRVESLNAAVAGSLMLYHAARGRGLDVQSATENAAAG